MKNINKKLFAQVTLSSMLLIATGCAQKSTNGTYASAYSYHPYLKQQKSKLSYKYQRQTFQSIPIIQSKINHFQPSHFQPQPSEPKPFTVKLAKQSAPKATPNKKNTSACLDCYATPLKSKITTTKRTFSYKRKPMLSIKPKVNNYQFQPTHTILSNIENTAKSLLGIEYQYGANGPYQYDCSSFTKYVFAKQGINLPRVSRDQAQRGKFISSGQLQKGDLIFFDSKKSTKVSHVGIYLGNGDFIHASSAKNRVTISNLRSDYYSKHFKWGRRVIQPQYNYAMR